MKTQVKKLKNLENKKNKLEEDIRVLREVIAPLEEQLMKTCEDFKKAKEAYHELFYNEKVSSWLATKEISQEEIDFVLFHKESEDSSVKYRLKEKLLREKYLLRNSGYVTQTDQTGLEISLTKGDKERTQKVCDSILVLLPHIKPIMRTNISRTKDYFNRQSFIAKSFGIFENTLSEYGIYSLYISNNDTEFHIMITKYGHTEILNTFSSLMDALNHIEKNIWYESKDKMDRKDYEEEEEESDY